MLMNSASSMAHADAFAIRIPLCHYRVRMMARYKRGIGLLLVVAVVALYVSTCVPMPKLVRHSSHSLTAVFFHSANTFGPALVASLWRPHLTASPDSIASGTDLINRICSRIC
jgi:hypothetical protein